MTQVIMVVVFAGLTMGASRLLGPARMRWITIVAGAMFAITLYGLADRGASTGLFTALILFGTVAITSAAEYLRRPAPDDRT